MARRRSWTKKARAAHGLASGAQDYFAYLMKQQMADRSMAHQAKLAEDRDERTLARQGQLAIADDERTKHQKILDLLPRVASEGDDALTPDALLSMAAASGVELFPGSYSKDYVGTGEPEREREQLDSATRGLLDGLRPPMRRKLQQTVGATIDKAKTLEELPGAAAIGMQALAADDRAGQGPHDPFGAVDQNDPLMRLLTMAPEVSEYANQALDKRDTLLNAPGDRLAIDNPDGSQTTRRPTRAQEVAGITTKPNATVQGTNKGTTEGTAKKTELGIAGPALVKQAGAEGYARKAGDIRATLAFSKELIAHDVAKAKAELDLIPDRVARTKAAENIAEAHQSANKLLPAVTQLQRLWIDALPDLQGMGAAIFGRAGLGAAESFQPGSTLPPNVKKYSDLVDAVRPMLARAFGQTGNPALMEQEWAKYVPNYSEAMTPATAFEKLARLEALGASMVEIASASARGPLTGDDIDAILQPRVQTYYDALLEDAGLPKRSLDGGAPLANTPLQSPAAGATFIVTPSGIQLAPGGRRPGGR